MLRAEEDIAEEIQIHIEEDNDNSEITSEKVEKTIKWIKIRQMLGCDKITSEMIKYN